MSRCGDTILNANDGRRPAPVDLAGLVIRVVRRQLKAHPASTLCDIYKSFFQDEFGPGHLLDDPDAARVWFDRELNAMSSRGRHDLDPCGIGRRFCRASMDVVLDGLVGRDEFFDAFVRGASGFRLPDPEIWVAKWTVIAEALGSLREEIPGFDADAANIASALTRGHFIMHHSHDYVAQYDPHYRIMTIPDATGLGRKRL